MRKNGPQISLENDLKALLHIHNFGWLRATELGRLLWPEAAYSTKNAERWARKAIEKGLVIPRKLPNHNGTALVVSQPGADLLAEFGYEAKTGKDWGETKNGTWIAPKWWRHDLMANGLLTLLKSENLDVWPERQLRRENPNAEKLPDGLVANSDHSVVIWIEVESARKSGKAMDNMATYLIAASIGNAPVLSGMRPTAAVVAYQENALDERGFQLDHKTRTISGIERNASQDFSLQLIQLHMQGAGVREISLTTERIESEFISQQLAKIHFQSDDSGNTHACWQDKQIAYRHLTDTWRWEISTRPNNQYRLYEEDTVLDNGEAESEHECRRNIVHALFNLLP